ncbi:MAG: polysaccharide biosynthesis tyrosine autokinase [Cyanobacteria bacterium P01_A01_bin.116]
MSSETQLISRKFLQEQDAEGGLQLDRFAAVLRRRVLLIVGVTVLTASAALAKAVTDKPNYQSRFELLTPPVTLETEIISTINPDALSNQSEAVGVGVLDETKIKILTSPRVMQPIVDELRKSYPNISYNEVTNKLNITPNDKGQTLTVKYKGSDPEKVVKVLDVVSEAYLRYSLEDRQTDIFRGVDFVDEQLPAVKARVNELEAKLENLRQDSNLIDPLLQGEQLSAQMAKFNSEQLELRVQIEQTEQLYQDLQLELNQGGELASTSALLDSPRYQALLNQLLDVDSQLADDLTLYLEDSPEIAVIAERRENIQPLLEREGRRVQDQVGSLIRELIARDQALSRSILTLDERIKRLSSVAREYNTIQRDLDIAATNLNEFLTKREALRIDAAQRQTPWEILTPHEYPEPSEANTVLNLVLGALLGSLLGAALAIVVDRMSDKIYSVKELKQAGQIPVLGTIPYNQLLEKEQIILSPMHQRSDQENAFSASNNSFRIEQPRYFLEAFRRLATNVRLNSLDSRIGSLVVSSALPNEGKSSVSFYLAHASALMGQRTLLIDTDLRHPTLHKLCNVSNERGLSNYLTGEVSLSESMISLPMDEKLFFIPSGTTPADPAKVLSSAKMDEFYREIYKAFDLVIFDTPPLLGFADAFMVAKKTQGVLLTARLGQVKFSQLESVLDDLHVAKVPTIGVVANDSRENNNLSNDYYQYYEDFSQASQEHPVRPVAAINSNGKVDDKAGWQKTISNILGKT